VALIWLLLMTLGLPLADYARSPRPLVTQLQAVIPPEACIAAPGLAPATVAALEYFGRWRVDARPGAAQMSPQDPATCGYLLRVTRARPLPPAPVGWVPLAQATRPRDRDEVAQVFRRQP
jgi:hypothetical protein